MFTPVLLAAALVAVAARPWAHGVLAWFGFALLLIALLRLPARPRGLSWASAGMTGLMGVAIGLVAFEGVAPAAPLAFPALVLLTALPWALIGLAFARVRARQGEVIAAVSFPVLVVTVLRSKNGYAEHDASTASASLQPNPGTNVALRPCACV